MAEVAFDTTAEVRRLRDAGFRQEQAEALARPIHAGVTGGVATKADPGRLGVELGTEIADLRTGTATGQAVQLRWVTGVTFGLVVALDGVPGPALFLQALHIHDGGIASGARSLYDGLHTVREARMAEVAFDTIAEVRRLRDVGFKQEQAEAITRSIHAGVTGGVATRTDLAMAETGLRGDMERLGGELRTEIGGVRTELKEDIAGLRTEIGGVRTELKEDIAGLRTEIAGVRTEVGDIRTQIAEGQAVQLRWVAGMAIAMFAALVGILFL